MPAEGTGVLLSNTTFAKDLAITPMLVTVIVVGQE